jgi:hypothetical protein
MQINWQKQASDHAEKFAASEILLPEVSPKSLGNAYLIKLRYEVSASTSSGFNVRATSGIGDPGVE